MKKKNNTVEAHDYLFTSCWYKEMITDPRLVIADFFNVASVGFFRGRIKHVLLATQPHKIYKKDQPGDLLHDFAMLESVINAAYLLNKEERPSPVSIADGDLLNPKFYCGWNCRSSEWDFIPRHLTVKEYKHPYVVFKKFFRYQTLPQWKEALEQILRCALVKNNEAGNLNTLPIYLHLAKLIEALHLIDVRENTRSGLVVCFNSASPASA